MRFRYFRDWLMGSESWWRRAWLVTLQDFTVLPTEIFRWCVISISSVIYLLTSSPIDYVRRLSLRWWFPIPSLYRSETQKSHLPMVLQTEFARQKKEFPAWNIPTDFHPSVISWFTDGYIPSVKLSVSVWNTDRIYPSINSSVTVSNADRFSLSVNLSVSVWNTDRIYPFVNASVNATVKYRRINSVGNIIFF